MSHEKSDLVVAFLRIRSEEHFPHNDEITLLLRKSYL
jgi:hypothetical protein